MVSDVNIGIDVNINVEFIQDETLWDDLTQGVCGQILKEN